MSRDSGYKIAVPLYLWPGYGHLPCAWERLLATPEKNPIVVVNPNSGPGDKFFELFKSAVDKCQAAGIKVLGYVRTIYAKRSLADIEQDLQLYRIWYNVDGFFIDEMYHWGEAVFRNLPDSQWQVYKTNLCTADASQVPLYLQIKAAAIKVQPAQPILVLNPGCASFPEAYMEVGDIFVVFEHSADTYPEFRPPAFLSKYPKERFWHMIYASRADTAAKTLALFQRHHAGYLYLTDLDLDNPYKDLPTDDSIWQLQLSAA